MKTKIKNLNFEIEKKNLNKMRHVSHEFFPLPIAHDFFFFRRRAN
jgi:hypothetical protein